MQQLLPDGLAFSNADNAGELKEVFINGSKVAAAPRVVASADLGQGSAQPIKTEIDSNSIRGWLEEGGDITDRAVEVASQGVKMFWQSRMWENFAQIIWFFIGFSMMTSRMFLSENRRTQFGHIYGATAGKIGDCAALVSLVLIWVFYAFLIANVFVVAIGGANPFYLLFSMMFNWSTLLVALWLLFVIGLSKTSDALVQNPKVVKPAGNGGGQGGYNNAQIGSGRD